MKTRILCTSILLLVATSQQAQEVSQTDMAQVYEEVKTPYKQGIVVAPKQENYMTDCPTVFRVNGRWYMTYVIFDGSGYETWVSQSDDLVHWTEVGCIMPRQKGTWDAAQRAAFPALTDWRWDNGSYELQSYKGRYWMSYFGGENTGYEAKPLNIGITSIPRRQMEEALARGEAPRFEGAKAPVLSINDEKVQWFERGTYYKPMVYADPDNHFGSRFVMFYNAFGHHPQTGLGAERIGVATSDDMQHWSRYEGNPVMAHEVKGTITGDAQIVRMGDLYVMFYFRAFEPSRKYKAFNTFACSRDLVHWTDWQGPDLVVPSESYDARYAHKSYVLKWQGVVYHFYCAVDQQRHRAIALATSKELKQNTKTK